MPYKLEKTFTFEAAHQLKDHDGNCARLHGHSWRATIVFEGTEPQLASAGPKRNMLVDYGRISELIAEIREPYLDHRFLNETLETDMPTSEYVAKWLFRKLKFGSAEAMAFLKEVVVEETCTSRCSYRE